MKSRTGVFLTMVFAVPAALYVGCGSGGEVNNPYPLRVSAEQIEGAATQIYNTVRGRFYCDDLPDPGRCLFPGPDAGFSTGSSSGGGWDACKCQGSYHIETPEGLNLTMDPQLLALGRILVPGKGILQARYNGQSGDATIYISKMDWVFLSATNQYYLDVAGGFKGTFGVVKFSRGFFYSVKPEGNNR